MDWIFCFSRISLAKVGLCKWNMEMQVDTQRGLRQVGQIGTTLWVGLVWNYCGRMQKHAGSLVFLTVLTHDGPFPDHEGHQGQSPPQILTILYILPLSVPYPSRAFSGLQTAIKEKARHELWTSCYR